MKSLLMVGLLASAVWAADYSQMSTEEMMKMRGSVPVDDRPAFRAEMQKRMQSMSDEEWQNYMGQSMMGKRKYCMKKQPTFEEYDLNSDGKITESELNEAREKRMAKKKAEGKMLRHAKNAPAFAEMDKNKDGALDREEFRLHQEEQMKKWSKKAGACGCASTGKKQGMGRNAPSFADIDTDKDGVISQEEFRIHQMQRSNNCPTGNCP